MKPEKKIKGILSELSGEKRIKNIIHNSSTKPSKCPSMVTLLIEIEEQFGIELDEKDMNPLELTDVQSVIDMVKKYGGE